MKTLVSVDPGATGGLAIKHGNQRPIAFAMPDTEGDVIDLLAEHRLLADREGWPRIAYVEDVPKFCGQNRPASSIAVMYGSYKFVLGALQATHWRVELVRPQRWQKGLGLGTATNCATRSEWKNKLKAHAQRLYPELKVTLATADALLLLEYVLNQERRC